MLEKTGVFYHPSFSRRSYLTIGNRLKDFPDALDPLLGEHRNIKIFECKPVSEDFILKNHSESLLEGVKRDWLCSTAWHSAGGVIEAMELIWKGEIRNAFAYIGAGGHHAGRNFFGGFCCFNDVVLAITNLREKYGTKKIAILDTDAHHGDGTRDLIGNDPNILHVCLCWRNYESADGTKVDVSTRNLSDESYVQSIKETFVLKAREMQPDLIVWYFGHDTHRGDYGSIGLTTSCYKEIATLMKETAEELCGEKLLVVLGGGSKPDIARESSLKIIEELAKKGKRA